MNDESTGQVSCGSREALKAVVCRRRPSDVWSALRRPSRLSHRNLFPRPQGNARSKELIEQIPALAKWPLWLPVATSQYVKRPAPPHFSTFGMPTTSITLRTCSAACQTAGRGLVPTVTLTGILPDQDRADQLLPLKRRLPATMSATPNSKATPGRPKSSA